jgi:hypothetical protein
MKDKKSTRPESQKGEVASTSSSLNQESFWDRKWAQPMFTAVMAFVGAVGGYWMTEHSREKWKEFEAKESHYHALVVASRGFMGAPLAMAERVKLSEQFFQARDLCRIQCPDHILKQLNVFTDRIMNPGHYTDQDLQFRRLVLEMRKDLNPKTNLTEMDFKF